MQKNYEIKITGSGTRSELANTLLGIVRDINNHETDLDEYTNEDPILYTQIEEAEPEEETTLQGDCLDQ